jgi:hypothetical protein
MNEQSNENLNNVILDYKNKCVTVKKSTIDCYDIYEYFPFVVKTLQVLGLTFY